MYLYIKRVVIEEKFKSEFLKIWVITTSGERDMSSFLLKSTNKIREENIIHQRITSARRPKTVRNRATYDNEVTSSES